MKFFKKKEKNKENPDLKLIELDYRIKILEDKLKLLPEKYPIRLSENEETEIIKLLKNSKRYLEFGSGGSTFLAALNMTNKNIISVESDKNWLNYIKEWKIMSDINIRYVDIGEVKEWGIPKNEEKIENWYKYSKDVFSDENAKNSDLIFIDGRFRVACALCSILYSTNNPVIAILDFWDRPQYGVLLDFLDVVNKIDTLGIFKIKEKVEKTKVASLYEKYKNIYD